MSFLAARRLDELVTCWEDTCLIARAATEISRREDPSRVGKNMPAMFKNFRDFRGDLKTGSLHVFPVDKFYDPDRRMHKPIVDRLGTIAYVPMLAWRWVHSSRRVYELDAALQRDLELTAAPGITWRDVQWPFPAFAISLGEPMAWPNCPPIDTLIVSVAEGKNVEIYFVSKTLSEAHLRHEERQWLRGIAFEGEVIRKLPKAKRRLSELAARNRLHKSHLAHLAFSMQGLDEHVEVGVQTILDATRTKANVPGAIPPVMDLAKRLVVNVALWQMSLPAAARAEDRWRPTQAEGGERARAITEGTRVFDLSGQSAISREKLERLKKLQAEDAASTAGSETKPTGRTLASHFRSGYWRRLPGTGKDPNAPKIQHISWTIVNEDTLEEGELPEGSVTTYKP